MKQRISKTSTAKSGVSGVGGSGGSGVGSAGGGGPTSGSGKGSGGRVRTDLLRQQMELIALQEARPSSAESFVASLVLRFLARKEVSLPDLLGVCSLREDQRAAAAASAARAAAAAEMAAEAAAAAAADSRTRRTARKARAQSQAAAAAATAAQQQRRRRPLPRRCNQFAVLTLCLLCTLGIGLFFIGMVGPKLLEQNPSSEPWFTLYTIGSCMIHLLVLGLTVPALFPAVLRLCCPDFMRYLRETRFQYE